MSFDSDDESEEILLKQCDYYKKAYEIADKHILELKCKKNKVEKLIRDRVNNGILDNKSYYIQLNNYDIDIKGVYERRDKIQDKLYRLQKRFGPF